MRGYQSQGESIPSRGYAGSGFRVPGPGSRVSGSEFRVCGFRVCGFKVSGPAEDSRLADGRVVLVQEWHVPVSGGLGFGIQVSGICVSGFEFWDPGLGFMVQCLGLKDLGLGIGYPLCACVLI